MAKYVIGLDYGTLSVRAILVEIATGECVAQSVYEYPHAVMETHLPTGEELPNSWALQDPRDYEEGLVKTIHEVLQESRALPEEVAGIGVDFTAATVLPVLKDMTPLSMTEEFMHEKHAYVKLWKHHGAEKEAVFIDRVARERNEEWLPYYGGKVSSEWTIPKVLETLRYAPAVYEKADYFMEAMDWIVWKLTGTLTASACGMGYKVFYFRDKFPSTEFFKALDPRMENVIAEKFNMPVLPVGAKAGGLSEEMAQQLHLNPGTPVATAIIDAHSSVPGGGVGKPGELMIIMGTSSCHLMLAEKEAQIPGIQGIVRDGIMPGFYGIEAGQACVGDHFAWAVETCMPESYAMEAREKGISKHQFLSEKLAGYRAGESGLLALDWFNGVRSPLMDFDLNGMILGMNLQTKPEDIYLALIEATAYGTRAIVESFEEASVPVNSIVLAGGIPSKNELIVQIYADILNRPVKVCASDQACAMGAAVLAATAAGEAVTGMKDASEIAQRFGRVQDKVYTPDSEQSKVYEELFADYMTLHQYFGKGGNDVMRRLNKLRKH
ncbi:MAG: ribulokinase [Lachnospiraceae bacterium]|nr:ribulokinase [Lachnospiraceae bacterium]